MSDDIFLRIRQVTARTGLSRATIYNMMDKGTFPMKTALGVRAVGWLDSEIVNWMAGRKDVAKAGREVRPGSDLPSKAKKSVAVPQARTPAKPASNLKSVQPETIPENRWAGWEDALPPLEPETDGIKFRMQLANLAKTSKPGALARSTKATVIRPTQRTDQATVVGGAKWTKLKR